MLITSFFDNNSVKSISFPKGKEVSENKAPKSKEKTSNLTKR